MTGRARPDRDRPAKRGNRDFVFAAVAEERRRISALISDLDPRQLATPSLCAGWDVKTVAAHLVSVLADSFWRFQRMAVRCGGIDNAIDALARERAALPAQQIAAALRERADHRLSPPITGPRSGLTDVLVHGADIMVPLDLRFNPDPRRVALALDFLTGRWPLGFVPRGRLRGISLFASDIDRSWGKGAEIHGPAAALMIAACGRTALFHTLDGPGVPILEGRLS